MKNEKERAVPLEDLWWVYYDTYLRDRERIRPEMIGDLKSAFFEGHRVAMREWKDSLAEDHDIEF